MNRFLVSLKFGLRLISSKKLGWDSYALRSFCAFRDSHVPLSEVKLLNFSFLFDYESRMFNPKSENGALVRSGYWDKKRNLSRLFKLLSASVHGFATTFPMLFKSGLWNWHFRFQSRISNKACRLAPRVLMPQLWNMLTWVDWYKSCLWQKFQLVWKKKIVCVYLWETILSL